MQVDSDNIKPCPICLETVNDETSNSYVLPECGCEFHVGCVIHWFRQGHNTCPCCRNKGQSTDRERRTIHKPELSHIRKFARKNPDHEINKILTRLKNSEQKKKNLIAQRKALEDSAGIFRELRKKISHLTRKIWKNNWDIIKIKDQISREYPVSHIIVVTKKTV